MPKKKIIIFIDWFIPAYKAGGPIKSILNLVTNLKSDFDFWIVCSNEDINNETLEIQKNKLNIWLSRDDYKIMYLEKSQRNLSKIRSILVSIDFDYLYLNSLFSIKFSLIPLLLSRRMKIKTILAPRGMIGDGALSIKPLKKRIFITFLNLFKITSKLIWHATDINEKNDILNHFGKNSCVRLASNLSSVPPAFSERKKKVGSLNLFFISRITEKKRLLFALETLKKIKSKFVINFTIIGPVDDIDYWEQCQNLINELPTNINTEYLGPIPNDEINKALINQHVLFLPSQHENFGHVIVESWQNSCPVLISDKTPWRDLESNKLGFDISLNNQNGYINAIEFL